MFREKYPPTPRGNQRMSIYPPAEDEDNCALVERIYLDLIEKIIINTDRTKKLIEVSLIENLAKKIFDDVNFKFYEDSEEGPIIFFEPTKIDKYSDSYTHHYIAVDKKLRIPTLTISTGNRGAIELHPRQRKKYFQFVNELYETYVASAIAQHYSNLEILAVDDNNDTRFLLRGGLKGITKLYSYSSSEAALEDKKKWENSKILISDGDLPGMDGEEFAGEVRKIIPNIPIIYLTANTNYKKLVNPEDQVYYIEKPYKISDLKQIINNILLTR